MHRHRIIHHFITLLLHVTERLLHQGVKFSCAGCVSLFILDALQLYLNLLHHLPDVGRLLTLNHILHGINRLHDYCFAVLLVLQEIPQYLPNVCDFLINIFDMVVERIIKVCHVHRILSLDGIIIPPTYRCC